MSIRNNKGQFIKGERPELRTQVVIICKCCGKDFMVQKYREQTALFCSYQCKFKFQFNGSSWSKGLVLPYKERPSMKGRIVSPSTVFKKGHFPAHMWKGDNVGYVALHAWVRRKKGKAKKCEHCGSDKNVQWANKDHEYKRNLIDWLSLCGSCHSKYDRENGIYGKAKNYINGNKP